MIGMAHTCNPRTWETRQEAQEFKVILSYVVSLKPI